MCRVGIGSSGEVTSDEISGEVSDDTEEEMITGGLMGTHGDSSG